MCCPKLSSTFLGSVSPPQRQCQPSSSEAMSALERRRKAPQAESGEGGCPQARWLGLGAPKCLLPHLQAIPAQLELRRIAVCSKAGTHPDLATLSPPQYLPACMATVLWILFLEIERAILVAIFIDRQLSLLQSSQQMSC